MRLHDLHAFDCGEDGNLSPFGSDLRSFLHEPAQFDMLPGCGWLDGGCLILADALRAWSSGRLELAAWVYDGEGADNLVDHYCVRFTCEDGCVVLIDGDGLFSPSEMQEKMDSEPPRSRERRLHVPADDLYEQACRDDRDAIEVSPRGFESTIVDLSRKLGHRFGRFDEALLGLDCVEGDEDPEQYSHNQPATRPSQ